MSPCEAGLSGIGTRAVPSIAGDKSASPSRGGGKRRRPIPCCRLCGLLDSVSVAGQAEGYARPRVRASLRLSLRLRLDPYKGTRDPPRLPVYLDVLTRLSPVVGKVARMPCVRSVLLPPVAPTIDVPVRRCLARPFLTRATPPFDVLLPRRYVPQFMRHKGASVAVVIAPWERVGETNETERVVRVHQEEVEGCSREVRLFGYARIHTGRSKRHLSQRPSPPLALRQASEADKPQTEPLQVPGEPRPNPNEDGADRTAEDKIAKGAREPEDLAHAFPFLAPFAAGAFAGRFTPAASRDRACARVPRPSSSPPRRDGHSAPSS